MNEDGSWHEAALVEAFDNNLDGACADDVARLRLAQSSHTSNESQGFWNEVVFDGAFVENFDDVGARLTFAQTSHTSNEIQDGSHNCSAGSISVNIDSHGSSDWMLFEVLTCVGRVDVGWEQFKSFSRSKKEKK